MFGKWYAQTYTGSMCGKGPVVFAVWGYIVAHTYNGLVELNPILMAAAIGCAPREVEEAIVYLQEPDPDSRTKDENGRRLIREGQFMYRVPTHNLYRNIRDQDDRREYNRKKKRESRLRTKTVNTNLSTLQSNNVSPRQPSSALVSPRQPITDNRIQNTERKKEGALSLRNFQKPTIEEIRTEVAARGNKIDPEAFFNFYESKGWKVGNQTMKNWKAAIVTWEKREKKSIAPATRPDLSIGAKRAAELERKKK